MPVPVISDEVPDPIWEARFINGLAGEGNPQRVGASRGRRLRIVAHMAV